MPEGVWDSLWWEEGLRFRCWRRRIESWVKAELHLVSFSQTTQHTLVIIAVLISVIQMIWWERSGPSWLSVSAYHSNLRAWEKVWAAASPNHYHSQPLPRFPIVFSASAFAPYFPQIFAFYVFFWIYSCFCTLQQDLHFSVSYCPNLLFVGQNALSCGSSKQALPCLACFSKTHFW